tara:strand:- start:475 stop:1491 length:1017 start_codon:yes stop_codon:yes gene_type:complete
MNILFYCPFKFNIRSKNIKSLGGIESLNIELTKYLSNTKHKIYLATKCNKEIKKGNLINIPINKLNNKGLDYKFDKIISSNDPTIFNYSKYSKKFLWLHNKLPIEKAFRKKKFFPIIKNKVSAIFVSDYLMKKTTNIYNFKKKIVIPNFLDPVFSNFKPQLNRKPYFIWSVQRDKGLGEVIDIWINNINPKYNKFKLFIFGVNKTLINNYSLKKLSKFNIFYKGRVKKKNLINYYKKSMAMICLGYDETFCLNAIESYACGMPIITFGHTAVAEISNKKNSFKLLNYNDIPKRIIQIASMDLKSRKNTINNCVKFSRKYYLNSIFGKWLKLINKQSND